MGFIAAAAQGSRNGLGDYFDGTDTWHYDAAAGVYVNQDGAPAQQPTTTTTQQPAGSVDALVGQYGSTPNAQGGYTYTPQDNPYLQTNPTNTGSAGVTQNMNPNFYATLEAAQQFAAALGGQVVIDPTMQIGGTGSPIYAVQLPDGTTANAGAIAQILGNDAAFGNANVKSGEIAKLFGASYQPGIAEALASGTPVQLDPGPVAPGYNPTPLSESYTAPTSSTTTTTKTATPTSGTTTTTTPKPPTVTAGSPLDSTLKVINDKLTQLTGKQTADSITGSLADNWALWAAAALAAYFLFIRKHQE